MNTPATPELVQQAIGFYSHSPDGQYDEIAVQALRHYLATLQSQPAAAGVSDDDLRAMWRQHGGMFHGPLIETGTMPEAKLLAFLRAILRPQAGADEVFLPRRLAATHKLTQLGYRYDHMQGQWLPTQPAAQATPATPEDMKVYDGIAADYFAETQQATPEPGRCKHGHRHYCGHCGPVPDASAPVPPTQQAAGEPVGEVAAESILNQWMAECGVYLVEKMGHQWASQTKQADLLYLVEKAISYTHPAPGVPEGAREALERIASWNEHPAMLGVDYGSNGVRDYYRKIARDALADAQANGGVQ